MNLPNDIPNSIAEPLADPAVRQTFFSSLRELRRQCRDKANLHDQAIVCITACLEAGIANGKRIVGILHLVGFHKRHAGKVLFDACGQNPVRYRWWKDDIGNYHPHPDHVLEAAAQIAI